MGNVRTKDIKRAAFQIKEIHGDKLSKDFEKNKQAIKDLNLVENKRMRNKIAGYAVRVMRRPSN